MKNRTQIFTLMLFSIALGLLYFWHDTAEAARLGGGRSFGSRPSYQRSAPAPAPNPSAPRTSPAPTAQQKPSPGLTPSPAGRWGGMLGGLLMGGLIGSLLFGGGHGAGGFGLLELLLVGGGLLLLFRFMRSRRMAAESPSAGGAQWFERASEQTWGSDGHTPAADEAMTNQGRIALPEGFDADEFLKGASAIYTRLQTSWDKRDLNDIRQFTSPEVSAEIQRQAEEDPEPGKTELLLITPRLIEVREEANQTIASVLYDVLMREDGDGRSKQVRELWHFSREKNRTDDFWVLEGIQQIER